MWPIFGETLVVFREIIFRQDLIWIDNKFPWKYLLLLHILILTSKTNLELLYICQISVKLKYSVLNYIYTFTKYFPSESEFDVFPVWKNEKFTLFQKNISSNQLFSNLIVKLLISRNVCQKGVFSTVWKLRKFSLTHFWQKFRESNGFIRVGNGSVWEIILA